MKEVLIIGIMTLSFKFCYSQNFSLVEETESKEVFSNTFENIILYPKDSLFMRLKSIDQMGSFYFEYGIFSRSNDTITLHFSIESFEQLLQKYRNDLPKDLSQLVFHFNNYLFLQNGKKELELISEETAIDLNSRFPQNNDDVFNSDSTPIEVNDSNQIILPIDGYVVNFGMTKDNCYYVRVLHSTYYSLYKNVCNLKINSKGFLSKNSVIGTKTCLTEKIDYIIRL